MATRRQILNRSWRYDEPKNRYLGWDGEEHWTIEQDIGTGRWFAAHSGRSVTFESRTARGFTKHRVRTTTSPDSAMNLAELEAERLHEEQIKRRREAR